MHAPAEVNAPLLHASQLSGNYVKIIKLC